MQRFLLLLLSAVSLHHLRHWSPASASRAPKRELTFSILLPMAKHNVSHMSLEMVQPVVDIAIENVKARGLLPLSVKVTANDSRCDYAIAPIIAILLMKEVDLMLGPYCSFCVAAVARYNKFDTYRKPVITAGGVASALKDKDEYFNLIRVGPSYAGVENMLQIIFQRYDWLPRSEQSVLFIELPDDDSKEKRTRDEIGVSQSRILSLGFEKHFVQSNYIVRRLQYEKDNEQFNAEIFRVMREEVRIVVLCADPDTVREIMIKAQELGFINGEYVFFNIDLFSSEKLTLQPWHRDNDTAERNEKAAQAYRALMTITLRKPNSPEYRNFSQQVKEMAKTKYNFSYPEEEVNSFVGAFHDAVLLYALAINDTLAQHGLAGIANGSLITEKMKNRTFEGITGTVSINTNGDRDADYSLLDMDKTSRNFTVVAHYYGNRQKYELVPGKEIDWYNEKNQPPPDIPLCGFDYSRCKKDFSQVAVYAVIVLLVLICVLAVVIVVIYRKLRLESELHAMNWRIPWTELEPMERIAGGRHNSESGSKDQLNRHQSAQQPPHSQRSEKRTDSVKLLFSNSHGSKKVSRGGAAEKRPLNNSQKQQAAPTSSGPTGEAVSLESVETIAGVPLSQIPVAQLFSKTAYYKGVLVALKPLSLRYKRIEVNNRLLMEVKKVKDLSSDNVIRFIGACLDTPNECLVSEYCPKGSLQDILENDNLNLDWMFKFSLMLDICRGMIYLHHNFGSHGNLKSSNCLVDSRFSLKIADFGLHSLRGSKEYKDKEDAEYSSYRRQFYDKLWTAPELLRVNVPPPDGTKEGDVYSFAIISQEIIYRKGVFFISDYDFPEPQDIIEKVKALVTSSQLFRPTLVAETNDPDHERSDALVEIVRSCWQEDPAGRPNFNTIKGRISRFNKEAESGNILDNLLKRMEMYSNNLESLVAKRTDQYLEEKKKAENLLYCMLPKSVATTLMKGESVTAEWFDSVTIYFSDICGFTALSSESTPLEVVTLLNDLYTLFDRIIEQYDCYKVETIGDAYMVVSGLPMKNGNLHAREIARMALSFLQNIFTFKIRHKPDAQLKLRIGIHSGPVCAGVVGLKMPRYCLFGDTVNTSSRMESNGMPLRIHISSVTKELLSEIGDFVTSVRGEVEMKGKGKQFTYWLHGEGDSIVDPITLANGSPEQAAV